MDREDSGLGRLRASMSEEQRRDMAQLVGNEVRRRQGLSTAASTSGNRSSAPGELDYDELGEVYANTRRNMESKGINTKIGRRTDQRALPATVRTQSRPAEGRATEPKFNPIANFGQSAFASKMRKLNRQSLLVIGIVVCALLKISLSLGAGGDHAVAKNPNARAMLGTTPPVEASTALVVEPAANVETAPINEAPAKEGPKADVTALGLQSQRSSLAMPGVWTPEEKELLTQLDSRRVELEKRRESLDARESEIKNQGQALNEKLAELRSLTARLSETRQTMDHRYEERLIQLAGVYGSMQPKEAAPLIGKLEDPIALALLERMPAKRLGQILSTMESERAIELTRQLTDKQKM